MKKILTCIKTKLKMNVKARKKAYCYPQIDISYIENERAVLISASQERVAPNTMKEEWKEQTHEYEFEW